MNSFIYDISVRMYQERGFSDYGEKVCMGGVLPGLKSLKQEDMEKIFEMCL